MFNYKLLFCFLILMIPLASSQIEVGETNTNLNGVDIVVPSDFLRNVSNSSVNASQFWDTNSLGPLDDANTTQFENSGGTLSILESWVDSLWCRLSGCTMSGPLTLDDDLTLSTFTQGSVLFIGSGGLVSENNTHFFWNNSKNALGLGIQPANNFQLDIFKSGGAAQLMLKSDSAGANIFIDKADNTKAAVWIIRSAGVERWRLGENAGAAVRDDFIINEAGTTRMLIEATTGNVIIGGGLNPQSGVKFTVGNGNILFAGDFSVNDGQSAMFVDVSLQRTGFGGITGPTAPVHVLTDSSGGAVEISENSGGESYTLGVNADGSLEFMDGGAVRIIIEDQSGDLIQIEDAKFLQGEAEDISLGFNASDRVVNAEVGSPFAFWTNFLGYFFDNDVKIEGDLNVTGNLEVGGNLTVGMITLTNNATVSDNSTCLFLASPDGTTVSEICNV